MITIKTKKDISILREGGRRHAKILRELVSLAVPGAHSSELNRHAEELIKKLGDKPSFLNYRPAGAKRPYPASLCVSVNDEIVHGIPNENDKILKEGDIVGLDLGLSHHDLITDMAVTIPVGHISPELEQLIRVTREALVAGIKVARGGNKIGDISSAIEQHALKYGYGIVRELSGHGVGYSVHEAPYVPNFGNPGKGNILRLGMVLAIEPMFNIGTSKTKLDKDGYTYRTADGKPSAHFEHTILITTGDPEILTQ
ncbi:MAG: type I methionyl aminopeptidase [Candidatus Taylorbacteria bacterium RIFCSPLOWO2_01_FULL_44_26]|uniref:Methionine aminopeptidase n=2 Tax=Candidatus Tayloriibacteriota TaxID=1817919 RepID=A0A1G2MKT7_9BACT|nr:MAG: type I methionyl aminopeptidase [Candidatus Taylorbacteria bacterium RIFCSPHIGHO2_02_FULL_44_12]OHA31091.1 MAG: type I methionyl aminopeptidase [Candidatus Taylorbacteria bacterium RIFCSPLOWO2_01_FULL_44_26]